MLDGLPHYLYVAFAIASASLCWKWWYVGQYAVKRWWMLYLAHLPLSSLIWSMEMWDTARWISVIGNLMLIACAIEAANACGSWIIPVRERRWVMIWAKGVGMILGAFVSMVVTVPADQPAEYFIPAVFSQGACIGIISAQWAYQRIRMERHVNNSRNAWHASLLMAYCALNVFNFATPLPKDDPLFWPKIYVTVTIKIAMLITWWFKVVPLNRRHVLQA